MKQQTLRIDPEFKAQIPPLTEDERKQLEENILADGEILSPILVWNDTIVDGHNRYEILQNHPEIPFTVYPLTLENREQVLVWICKNQLGRRNLTPEQKKFLIGKQYDAEKHDGFHGNQHTLPASSGGVQNEHQQTAEKTCERIARENRVSSSSVRRAALFAQGVDLADKLCPGIRLQVLRGDLKAPDILFERLAKAGPEEYDDILEQIKNPRPKTKPTAKQQAPQLQEHLPTSYTAAKLPYAEPHFEEVGGYPKDPSAAYAQLDVAAATMQESWTFIFEHTPSLRTEPEHRKAVQAILEKHLTFLASLGCNLPEFLKVGEAKSA